MFQWFDSIEVTLRQRNYPDNLRTVNATGVFQSHTLDWWTDERNKRGNDAAYGLTWDELKDLMIKELCPPHELQKLEDEFWHLKQKDGDNAALTARFKQLSIICPGQVTTPEITIKKYICALPNCVADFVQAAKTSTIEETFLLAAEINDKRVKAGYWDKASTRIYIKPPPLQPLKPPPHHSLQSPLVTRGRTTTTVARIALSPLLPRSKLYQLTSSLNTAKSRH
ncbi:putative retrotransposon gag domain-containing protein [Helianthus annuus]|nr:putative retrotransposon gag domain-containing protein [Helianthus annuus]